MHMEMWDKAILDNEIVNSTDDVPQLSLIVSKSDLDYEILISEDEIIEALVKMRGIA